MIVEKIDFEFSVELFVLGFPKPQKVGFKIDVRRCLFAWMYASLKTRLLTRLLLNLARRRIVPILAQYLFYFKFF